MRAKFLKKEFNPFGYSARAIMEIVQNTDKVSDRLNEITGQKVATELMYRRILVGLGYNPKTINDDLIQPIQSEVNKMFLNYPPLFLNDFIEPMLQELVNRGYSINISSNTGYIEGKIIRETLRNLNVLGHFKFLVFSDEINLSKPSTGFFEKVQEQSGFEKEEILHVGDNIKADYKGATKYGFKAYHINNNQYTINDITRHL